MKARAQHNWARGFAVATEWNPSTTVGSENEGVALYTAPTCDQNFTDDVRFWTISRFRTPC